MKRDMDLVRAILIELENYPTGGAPSAIEIEGYTSGEIGYHAYIMGQAGLIETMDFTDSGIAGPQAGVVSMRWDGHEFLDAAREPDRWQQAKDVMAKVGGASIAVWTAVLTSLVKEKLGL